MRRRSTLLLLLAPTVIACAGDAPPTARSSTTTARPTTAIERADALRWRITYRLADGRLVTIAHDPPRTSLRHDAVVIVSDGDVTVQCSADTACVEASGEMERLAGALAAPFLALSEQVGAEAPPPTSTRTVAGRVADCVTVGAGATTTTACVDRETGAGLRYETAGATAIEAVEFGEPTASDFTPTPPSS